MSKTKILLIQIAGCLALGIIIGVGWWLCDGGKPDYKGVLDEIRTIKPSHRYTWKPPQVKVYRGKWNKEGYLEVIK